MLCAFRPAIVFPDHSSMDSQQVVADYEFCAVGVVASNGRPVDGVDVALHIQGSSGDAERPHQTTNGQGEYSFSLCCSGEDTEYSLTFVKAGFQSLTVQGTSDCSAVQRIELVPEEDKQPNRLAEPDESSGSHPLALRLAAQLDRSAPAPIGLCELNDASNNQGVASDVLPPERLSRYAHSRNTQNTGIDLADRGEANRPPTPRLEVNLAALRWQVV